MKWAHFVCNGIKKQLEMDFKGKLNNFYGAVFFSRKFTNMRDVLNHVFNMYIVTKK